MKTSVLLLSLLLLPFLSQGFRTVQLPTPNRPGDQLTKGPLLEMMKIARSNYYIKQILRQLLESNLQKQKMKDSGKRLIKKLKQKDLVKIFSEEAQDNEGKTTKILFMARIQ